MKTIEVYVKTLKSGKTKFNTANFKAKDGNWYTVKLTKATGKSLNDLHQGYYNITFNEEFCNKQETPYVSKTGVEGLDRTLWIKDADVVIEASVHTQNLDDLF